MLLGSSPVPVTSPSDFAPASSKEFLHIQATIKCGFTLKRVCHMTRTYSEYTLNGLIFVRIILCRTHGFRSVLGNIICLKYDKNFPFAKFNRLKKSEKVNSEMKINVKPLSANITKWSNTLKQFFSKLPTNCFSVFDHFVGLALKRLITRQQCYY